MRVVVLPSWFPDNNNPLSGIFVKEQAMALSEVTNVALVVYKRGFFKKTVFYKEDNLEICEHIGFYFPKIRRQFLDIWADQYVEILQFYNRIEPIDIVHAHDHLAGYAAYKFHLKTKIPYVVTIHNTQFISQNLETWREAYVLQTLLNSNTVISVGEKLGIILNDKYTLNNLLVIPNLVDEIKFTLTNAEERRDGITFISIGALIVNKGFDILLLAFKKWIFSHNKINVELIIIGDGPERKNLIKLAKNLKILKHTKFLGWQKRESIPTFLHNSDIYISSSRVETFGITVLEALTCGLPCIVTNSGGPEQMINELNGIVVQNENVDFLADAMETVYLNLDGYNPSQIREDILKLYRKEKIVGDLLNLYKSILEDF